MVSMRQISVKTFSNVQFVFSYIYFCFFSTYFSSLSFYFLYFCSFFYPSIYLSLRFSNYTGPIPYPIIFISMSSRLKLLQQLFPVLGREPWSRGYRRRLMFQRSWVWIPALYTGWTFFTFNCCENCNACLKRQK